MTKINLSIPQPCHENWQAMTTADKGRFCNSCQKKVFDFTLSSDRDIVKAFEQNNNLCGRFLDTQLHRDLVMPKKKSSLWLATTTALISLVGLNEAASQEKTPTEQTEVKHLLGKPAAPKVENEEIKVSGIVADESGPLPGANIVVKGTKVSAQTNFDGKFSINANKGDILIISFIGYVNASYKVGEIASPNFILKADASNTTLGMLITPKKRTFFGRLFHKSRYRYD